MDAQHGGSVAFSSHLNWPALSFNYGGSPIQRPHQILSPARHEHSVSSGNEGEDDWNDEAGIHGGLGVAEHGGHLGSH